MSPRRYHWPEVQVGEAADSWQVRRGDGARTHRDQDAFDPAGGVPAAAQSSVRCAVAFVLGGEDEVEQLRQGESGRGGALLLTVSLPSDWYGSLGG
jgi:hypothetical protein